MNTKLKIDFTFQIPPFDAVNYILALTFILKVKSILDEVIFPINATLVFPVRGLQKLCNDSLQPPLQLFWLWENPIGVPCWGGGELLVWDGVPTKENKVVVSQTPRLQFLFVH